MHRTMSAEPPDSRQRYRDRLAPLTDYVREYPRSDLSVDALAKVVHFSPYHFHRVFTAVMGETVGTFVRRARLERATQLMRASPRRSLSATAIEAGFGSLSDFSRTFRRHYGMAPSKWDRRAPLNSPEQNPASASAAHAQNGISHGLKQWMRMIGIWTVAYRYELWKFRKICKVAGVVE